MTSSTQQGSNITNYTSNICDTSDTCIGINNNVTNNPIFGKPTQRNQNSFRQNYNKFNISENNSNINGNNELNYTHITNNTNIHNTEILKLLLHLNKEDEPKIFTLCRFDNLNQKIKNFCEMNGIDNKYIQPIEHNVHNALSKIYITYNSTLNERNREYINSLNILWNSLSNIDQTEADSECEDEMENVSSLSCVTDCYDSDMDRNFICDYRMERECLNKSF